MLSYKQFKSCRVFGLIVMKKNQISESMFYILCLFISTIFVYWQGQDRNWDLLNYHYYQGYSLLNGRFTEDIAAAGLQSFLNPAANVLAYLSLTYLPFPLSGWLIMLIQLSSIPAIVFLAKEIATTLGYPRAFIPAMPAIVLSLLAPLWWSELGTTFFSSWTAPFIIWGVYFIFSAYQVFGLSKKRIAIAGLLFGFAAGLKLTNALFAVSGFLMIAALLYQSSWRVALIQTTYFIVGCSVGFLLTAWWNWHLWSEWGSPVFPLYNFLFKSEFYDFVNFRDLRWNFHSIHDFLIFVVDSAVSTSKTSELPFADARYLLVAILVPVSILYNSATRLNRQLKAFILFMASSFILWALILPYQRYLIPFELLLGLLVWALVVRIVESDWLRKSLMLGMFICVGLLMQVPDWGHTPMTVGEKNPFMINMDKKLYATPARYVVVGVPISYVLPSFHPDSVFYGVGLSSQIDNLVFKKLVDASSLTLRILARDSDASLIPAILKRAGYDAFEHSLDCDYFRTGVGRYIVCEVRFQKLPPGSSAATVDQDFSINGKMKFNGILWERGLSNFEPWGRWSDGGVVELGLSNCLPQGDLKLMIGGYAFGPNAGSPVRVILGDKEFLTKFSDTVSQQIVRFTNRAICLNKMVIKIPNPISPQELGQSVDVRKLGIGFVSLKIIKE
jgi:hypothetical protein